MGRPLRGAETRAWLALVVAVGCFAVASALSIAHTGLAGPAATTTIAVAGAVPAGIWAVRVPRRTHAAVTLGLWVTVLPFAAGHVLVGGFLGWSAGRTGFGVALWTSTLVAGVATLYLGCREYGAPAYPTVGDDLLDGDVDS